MIRDRGFMRELLVQAVAARCSALIFAVDMPVPGSRYRDYRSGLAGAVGATGALRRMGQVRRPRWALGVDGIVVSDHGGRQLDGVPSTGHGRCRALPTR